MMATKRYKGVLFDLRFFNKLRKFQILDEFHSEYVRNPRHNGDTTHKCCSIMGDLTWSASLKGDDYWRSQYRKIDSLLVSNLTILAPLDVDALLDEWLIGEPHPLVPAWNVELPNTPEVEENTATVQNTGGFASLMAGGLAAAAEHLVLTPVNPLVEDEPEPDEDYTGSNINEQEVL